MASVAIIAADGGTVQNVVEGKAEDFANGVDVTGTSVSKFWHYDASTGSFSERYFATLDNNSVVTEVSRGTSSMYPDRVEATGSAEAQPGATYDPGTDTFTAPTAPPKSWNSRGEFLRQFTRQERIDIRSAAGSDSTVDDFLFMLDTADNVVADDSLVIEGMQYLVENGYLTDSRRNEILGV